MANEKYKEQWDRRSACTLNIVKSNSKYKLVIGGAGTGKSFALNLYLKLKKAIILL